jgi:hypothetical protein
MKMIRILMAVFVMSIFLAGCGSGGTGGSFVVDTDKDVVTSSDEVIIKSDPLPESWWGEWTCVYSEAHYFEVGETILVKDFDNAFIYTDSAGTYNRWFFYNEANKIIRIYNSPPPFVDEMWRDSFEIKKESDKELVISRLQVGQEVRFEKTE